MSVPIQNTVFNYIANGATTAFRYECYVIESGDLAVYLDDVLQASGYTVTGVGNASGGDVVFSVAPVAGTRVRIERDVDIKRDTQYQILGDFRSPTVNNDFDRIWMVLQRIAYFLGLNQGQISRFLKLGDGDINGLGSYRANQNRIRDLGDPSADQDAVNRRSMYSYVERMIAGVVGGFGWFIQMGTGAVYRTFQDKMRDHVSVFDFMTSEQIADVRSAAPTLDHTAAIDAALSSGAKRVRAPAGRYRYSGNGINVPQGVIFEGDGVDYWDTWRPNPGKFLKSDVAGTHIYFVGTGPKAHSMGNISNYRAPKTINGRTFSLTDFTLNDSVGGAPATPKNFSVGVIINKDSQLRNMRLLPSFNLIAGYNDPSLLTLADDWDVGVWAKEPNDCVVYNVQAVGYWRMAGWLLTENSGNLTEVGNAERSNFTKCVGQGRRGLLIRTAPQIPVVSNTTTTITVKYSPSCRITATNQFRVIGSIQLYTYSGYSIVGSDLLLTGVSPDLPANVAVIRAPNIGNGVSGSMFNDTVICSLDHTSGQPSSFFGIGEAMAVEADGFPLRAIGFNNTKWQTTYDHGCCLLGDIRDWKWTSTCQWENGVAIAYNNAEDIGYTENVRMEGEISPTVDLSQFAPREAWIPFLQIPTQFTDGSLTIRPWAARDVRLETYDGDTIVDYREADKTVIFENGSGFEYMRSNGATGETVISGNNISFKNATGTNIVNLFNGSLNAQFAANVTAGADLVSSGNTRPATDNNRTCGTPAQRWSVVYAGTGTINTSDERLKQDVSNIPDAVLRAWARVQFAQYKFIDAAAEKGDGEARWHFGAVAQRVKEAFEAEGLDPFAYGLLCYDEWGDEVEEWGNEYQTIPAVYSDVLIDENGAPMMVEPERTIIVREAGSRVVKTAGNRYGLRYEEALVLECAYLRSRLQ